MKVVRIDDKGKEGDIVIKLTLQKGEPYYIEKRCIGSIESYSKEPRNIKSRITTAHLNTTEAEGGQIYVQETPKQIMVAMESDVVVAKGIKKGEATIKEGWCILQKAECIFAGEGVCTSRHGIDKNSCDYVIKETAKQKKEEVK